MNSEFDDKAKGWDQNPDRVERAEAIARRIRETVPLRPDAHVLDFGSGTGLLGFQLLPHVASVTFADPSEGMLEEVNRKIQPGQRASAHVVRFDPESPALPARYDVIASAMTLHHVRDPAAVLRFLAEHLQPGGWLAIADLDTEDGSFHDPPNPDLHAGFDRDALVSRLRGAGLSEARAITAHVMRKERQGRIREYPIFLLTGQRPHTP